MNKIVAVILLVIILIMGGMYAYQFTYIHELRQDVMALSEDVQPLNEMHKDIQQLNGATQDMKFKIESIDVAVNLILTELWLVRPQVPDPRPWQAKE